MVEQNASSGGEGDNQGRPINIERELESSCSGPGVIGSPTTMHDILSRISSNIRKEGDTASRDDAYKVTWAYRILAVSEIQWEYTLLDLPRCDSSDWDTPLQYVYHQFREQQQQRGESGDELSLDQNQARALSYALGKAHLSLSTDIPAQGDSLRVSLQPMMQAVEQTERSIATRKEEEQRNHAVNRLLFSVFSEGLPPEGGTNDLDQQFPA